MFGRKKVKTFAYASLFGAFLLSCSPMHVNALGQELPESESSFLSPSVAPMKAQVQSVLEGGLKLDFSDLSIKIPGKVEGKDNLLDLKDASLSLRLQELSLHGLSADLDLPIDYNGVKKQANLSLYNEALYFSLPWEEGGFKFKSAISSYEEGGEDNATRGKLYYEYGSLDYFLYSILDSFGVKEINFGTSEKEKLEIDLEEVRNSLNEIEQVSASLYRLDLPLGEKTLSFGLGADSDGVWNSISFPLDENNHLSTFESSSNFEISFSASITPLENFEVTLPYPSSQYDELSDCLSLIKKIGHKVQDKVFGITADFEISHIEEEIEGDDEHFQRDRLEESASLSLSADVDLSSTYKDIMASLVLTCNEDSESLGLHIEQEEEEAACYLNLNNILKAKTSVETLSSFTTTLKDSFSDDSIQNGTLTKFISGLLTSADSISEAISAIKDSAVYESVGEGHFEGLLSAITRLEFNAGKLYVDFDLTKANGLGKIYVVLDAEDASLVKVTLENAGITSSSAPKLSLTISGSLEINEYVEHQFDGSSYTFLEHLPGIEDEIRSVAESDQLSVSLDGYFVHKAEEAVTSYTVPSFSGNRSINRRGFTFSGSMGFDLQAKTGSGKATITDRQEHFFQDHNLKIDVTGPANDSDSEEKDYLGNEGDTGYMLVEYDSKNATSGSGENRTSPSGDPLKGRFSIHSLNEVLDLVTSLLTSTDPRFKRLTNLFSNLTTKTTIGALLDGKYLEVLAAGFLDEATIDNVNNVSTFVLKKGLVMPDYPITLRVKYASDTLDEEGKLVAGRPSSIEVYSSSIQADGNEIYVKINLLSTDFSKTPLTYNWMGSSYSLSSFTSFSSIGTLLSYLLDTITLGVTDESSETTYQLSGSIAIKILTTTYNLTFNAFIYLDGTNVKVLIDLSVPKINPLLVVNVIKYERKVNIFYESNGEDSEGDLYITRTNESEKEVDQDRRRVSGSDFSDNMLDWILKYIIPCESIVTDQIDSASSSAEQSIHGEDIIKGFQTNTASGASFANPSWKLTLGMEGLTHVSLFQDLPLTITGKTVSYTDSKGKSYTKKSLYSASGTFDISLDLAIISANVVSATINANVANISSGTYTNAWKNGNSAKAYYTVYSREGWLIKKDVYTTNYVSGSAKAIFEGSYGKSSSNATYLATPYYVTPSQLA